MALFWDSSSSMVNLYKRFVKNDHWNHTSMLMNMLNIDLLLIQILNHKVKKFFEDVAFFVSCSLTVTFYVGPSIDSFVPSFFNSLFFFFFVTIFRSSLLFT